MIRFVLGACVMVSTLGTLTMGYAHAVETPRWAVDPNVVGAPLPPVGRSLFDYLVTEERAGQRVYNIPFPYSVFIQKLEERLQGVGYAVAQVKQVLMPLGRSLQRNAAAPDFFHFPRVVAAVNTEAGPRGDTGMLLKDRLYIGFGEKSAVLEVISYNEAAGRFEFQVVNDYRAGGTPQVAYADRAVCMSCHQNAALIFSRQGWDETNANPEIAALLRAAGKDFHGVAIEHGIDVPFAIDQATERANLFAVTQRLWSEGCGAGGVGARCRAAAFIAALQYRLSGERGFDEHSPRHQNDYVAPLLAQWRKLWPGGLYIPDADIPNRNPLHLLHTSHGSHGATPLIKLSTTLDTKGKKVLQNLIANTDIRAPFEPLDRRAPKEIWNAADSTASEHLVLGLADFIAQADVRQLDAFLTSPAQQAKAALQNYRSSCSYVAKVLDTQEIRLGFVCEATANIPGGFAAEGRVYLKNNKITRGTLERVVLAGVELRGFDISAISALEQMAGNTSSLQLKLTHENLHARHADGRVLENITLRWTGRVASLASLANLATQSSLTGSATLAVRDDFAPLRMAVDTLAKQPDVEAFAPLPFRRAVTLPAVLAQLGTESGAWCCLNEHGMPPVVDDRTGKSIPLR